MKNALSGLLLIAAWLAWLPAYAATYTYNVDYSFTTTPGGVAGSITTSCDSCVLTSTNVLSWSFTASDGTSGSSSGSTAGINASGAILEATPTGIVTVINATVGGFFAFCSDISNNGSDCFSTAGLNVDNIFHSPPQPVPSWHISWEENSSAEGIFSTDGEAEENPTGSGFVFPAIEIASLAAVPEPPAWAMMIIGFAACGFAANRRRRHHTKLRAALSGGLQ
jgi:hypothetical protein